jgi:hypothetical protein
LASLVRKERKGKRRGAAGSAAAAAAGGAGEKKERKGGEGETDEWGPGVSESREKEKRERTRAGAGRGMVGSWAAWAERVAGAGFLFFSSSFSNFIFKPIFISNSNQTFQTFSQKFYKLFRNLTSNQKPCKPTDDAQTLVVSKFVKLYLIF